ncbi:hypothetical protein DENSPDRAFT_787293 [Dentipellis sp. KUC8613]|nr:hypothetical protein DENSPDRAFT_787293 [Dentipellis sp. KUC8613]
MVATQPTTAGTENRATNELVRDVLVKKKEGIVSFAGTSQYGARGLGISACGLAALNFARVIFAKEQEGERDESLLRIAISKETAEEITAICAAWSSNAHLEVEEIWKIPLFESSLKLRGTKYGHPGLEQFERLLEDLKAIDTSAVVIITRPPEILACLKIKVSGTDVFIVFDSHSRPRYPDGAGFIIHTSVPAIAGRLAELLPVVDFSDKDLHWQAQLLSNYSGHVFVPRGIVPNLMNLTHMVMDTSLTLLALRSDITQLTTQNNHLTSENLRLRSELEENEERHRRELERLRLSSQTRPPVEQYSRPFGSSPSTASPWIHTPHINAVASSSRLPDRKSPTPSPLTEDFRLAAQLQSEWEKENDTFNQALQQQKLFNEENEHLQAQRAELAKTDQRRFECGICFEEHPEDFVARPDRCSHSFCRDCIRRLVITKLNEHRFPVLCPVCSVDRDKADPGVISQHLVLEIGITDKEYAIWEEMELSAFSVLIHCRQCKKSMFVDKDDVSETDTLVCPMLSCQFAWCKSCQQAIDIGGPKHSCDGSSELDHLMRERGWKYCPNCKTPIQKISGCNHMTCMSPGCNTHFCYVCGEQIVRSALRREIERGVTAHYRRCNLFEVPP